MKEVIKKEDVVVKEIKELKDVVKYEAIDGTIFNYKYECEEHELNCLWNKVCLTKKVIYNSFEGSSYYLCNNFDELNALFYNVSEISLDKHYDKNALENIKSGIFPQYFAIEEYNNAGYATNYYILTPSAKIEELSLELENIIERYTDQINEYKELNKVIEEEKINEDDYTLYECPQCGKTLGEEEIYYDLNPCEPGRYTCSKCGDKGFL